MQNGRMRYNNLWEASSSSSLVFKDVHTISIEFRDVCLCSLQSRRNIAE